MVTAPAFGGGRGGRGGAEAAVVAGWQVVAADPLVRQLAEMRLLRLPHLPHLGSRDEGR